MLKRIIGNITSGFEDGPHVFRLYNDFPLFFLVMYAAMFALITVVIVTLFGMLFFGMLTLSSSMETGLLALSYATLILLSPLWLLCEYATKKLWIISLKRHPFLRFLCPSS